MCLWIEGRAALHGKSSGVVGAREAAREVRGKVGAWEENNLTWLMLADMVEGIRLFFESRQAWFEMRLLVLDDTAGVVGAGGLEYRMRGKEER